MLSRLCTGWASTAEKCATVRRECFGRARFLRALAPPSIQVTRNAHRFPSHRMLGRVSPLAERLGRPSRRPVKAVAHCNTHHWHHAQIHEQAEREIGQGTATWDAARRAQRRSGYRPSWPVSSRLVEYVSPGVRGMGSSAHPAHQIAGHQQLARTTAPSSCLPFAEGGSLLATVDVASYGWHGSVPAKRGVQLSPAGCQRCQPDSKCMSSSRGAWLG